MRIEITDNSKEVLAALQEQMQKALTICGITAEGYAKKLCPVDTGLLRNSITYAVSGESTAISSYQADRKDKSGELKKGSYSGTAPEESKGMAVYIGTNVEYAAYQELGSGKHYDGGRKTKWLYKGAKNETHITGGNTAQPFLKPAIADHKETYRSIIEKELKGEATLT